MRRFLVIASLMSIVFAGAEGATPLPLTGRGWGWGEVTSGIDPSKFEPRLPSPILQTAADNPQQRACCVIPAPNPSPHGGGGFLADVAYIQPAQAEHAPSLDLKPLTALGKKLFSDPRLSKDGTMSCASCHDPKQAFTNPNPPSRPGVTDQRLRRDVPSLLNVAFATPLHHDGREPSLEVQILAPLFNEAEMANKTFDDLTDRLAANPEYAEAFDKAFASTPSITTLGQALAAYERSLIAETSAYDTSELPDKAKLGLKLFDGKAGCIACHAPPRFTANAFFNTGIGDQSEARRAAETPNAPTDRGREEVTHSREDRYKFRTPTLRNVELTAPYMHDGSLKTLEDVVAYYNTGGAADPEKDPRIKPLGLSDEEQRALVAFLKSLTSASFPGAK